MTRRIVAVVFAIIMTCLAAGCGGTTPTEGTTTVTQDEAVTITVADKTTTKKTKKTKTQKTKASTTNKTTQQPTTVQTPAETDETSATEAEETTAEVTESTVETTEKTDETQRATGVPITTTKQQPSKTTTTTSRRVQTTATSATQVQFPVEPFMGIAQRAIYYNNKLSSPKTKIRSDCFVVADYNPEYAFAHQPGFAYFKGKFYATWASGIKDEDSPGQRIVVSSSADNGETWSKPTVVADARIGQQGTVLTCMMGGYLWSNGNRLYNYFTEYEFKTSMLDKNGNRLNGNYDLYHWQVYVSYTEDGVHWSEMEPVDEMCRFNESPRKSLTGRWLAGAGWRLGYADKPDGYNWDARGVSNEQIASAKQRGAAMLNEASWYQTDDYVIHMMMRSNSGYIWMSESYDNGMTWTDAYQTSISSDSTMMNFGRLPDGRFYFVGSVDFKERWPLDLYISEDGMNFDKAYTLRDEKYEMQQNGWAKGGYFAYPEVLIHGDYMYVFYSKQKEVVELTRVKLSDIK